MDIRNVKTTVESSKYAVTMNGVKVTSVCSLDAGVNSNCICTRKYAILYGIKGKGQ